MDSSTRTAPRALSREAESALERVGWIVKNILQFAFLCFWSAFWISFALLTLCVTFNRKLSLGYARWAWAPPLLYFAQATMDVQGFEKLDPNQPYIYVFNHESLLDTTVVFYSVPYNIHFVAKKEVSRLPFIGWYCWAMGFVVVDRGDHERAMATMRKATKTVQDGASVIFFAEGTRSRDGLIKPFKKGAFVLAIEAGVPVVPCTISGSRDVLGCDGFKVRPATIHVRCGDPIPTAGLTLDDRDELMRRTRNVILDTQIALGGLGGERDPEAATGEKKAA